MEHPYSPWQTKTKLESGLPHFGPAMMMVMVHLKISPMEKEIPILETHHFQVLVVKLNQKVLRPKFFHQ